MNGTIFNIKKYALHDGPGIRTTVFLKGCPLACRWCHNPEGIDPDSQTIFHRTSAGDGMVRVGRTIAVDELMAMVEKDVLFYDESGGGVTFSGGEPLWQPAFLEAAAKACSDRDLHTVLDTSGYAPAEVAKRLFPCFRLVLYDLKMMDEKKHKQLTGASNRIILQNIETLVSLKIPFRIRIPVIPGMTDDDANIGQLVRFIQSLKEVQGVDLLPYHRTGDGKYKRMGLAGVMKRTNPPTPERMALIQRRFRSQGLSVTIGGSL